VEGGFAIFLFSASISIAKIAKHELRLATTEAINSIAHGLRQRAIHEKSKTHHKSIHSLVISSSMNSLLFLVNPISISTP
jgi:hypothetical protein